MNTTTMTWPGSSVVQPAIERPTAMRLAETEYQRVTDAVDGLQSEDWTRPTDCTQWDVRQLVAHIAGQARTFSSFFELVRNMRATQARQQPGQAQVDALTALQVEERQHLGPDELRAELRGVGARGLRGRRRIPGFLRRRRLPGTEVVNGAPESWSLGYLTDVILARDPWMHRLDLARATGRSPCSPQTTTASSSPTSWPSGPAATASPTDSSSPAQPAAAGTSARMVNRS
jgi:uncharacterized protein (TIGR03083 family)